MLSGVSVIVGIVGIVKSLRRHVVGIIKSVHCRVVASLCRCVVMSLRCRSRRRWSSQASLPILHLPPSSRQPLLLLPTPPLQPSVDGWLLCCLLHCLPPGLSSSAFVIVRSSTLLPSAAARRPLSPTFASRCPIHLLHRSRRWLVVAFAACPAAYQLNQQAKNVLMFPHLDLFDLLTVELAAKASPV